MHPVAASHSQKLVNIQHISNVVHCCVGQGEVEEAIAFMDEYGLSRDDIFETLASVRLGSKDYSKLIETKTKSAFTRKYDGLM